MKTIKNDTVKFFVDGIVYEFCVAPSAIECEELAENERTDYDQVVVELILKHLKASYPQAKITSSDILDDRTFFAECLKSIYF